MRILLLGSMSKKNIIAVFYGNDIFYSDGNIFYQPEPFLAAPLAM